jgi:hypothetical protein
MGIKGRFTPRYTSNSGLFSKRGDPWITNREGIKDFGRNPDTEDAEYDFDHRFHETGNTFGKPRMAEPRLPDFSQPPTPKDTSVQRRVASQLSAMHSRQARQARDEVKHGNAHYRDDRTRNRLAELRELTEGLLNGEPSD